MSLSQWIEKSKKEAMQRDIETSVNGIVSTTARLPYKNQVEVITRIKQALENRKIELIAESEEITECILTLNKWKL